MGASELGRALRRLGLSYGEIRSIIPVPKATLSYWCRDVSLTEPQVAAIKGRTIGLSGVPRDTQRKRRLERMAISQEARQFAVANAGDAFFVAGVMLYWGEGSKTGNELSLTNGDARISRLFIDWTLAYHDGRAEFVLKLNLHADNAEAEAKAYWRRETRLHDAPFHKTFFKPAGTGHRKNRLEYGVCLVRMRRSSDARVRTLAWIDALAQRPRW